MSNIEDCTYCEINKQHISELEAQLKHHESFTKPQLNEALDAVIMLKAQVAAFHMSLKRIGNEIAKQDHYYLGMIHKQEMSQHAKAKEAGQ